jgi:hypothetical protein
MDLRPGRVQGIPLVTTVSVPPQYLCAPQLFERREIEH